MAQGSSPARGGPLVRAVAATVDEHAPEALLVYGSLPDVARDLDVLVRPSAEVTLAEGLAGAGLERFGESWVLIEASQAVAVDITRAADWSVPEREVTDLFASAQPIPGYARLLAPAPHHEILILGRRLVGSPGPLDDRKRQRLEALLEEDPAAWERAGALARAWGCAHAVAVLRKAAIAGGRVRRRDAFAVLVERGRSKRLLPVAVAGAAASLIARPTPGAVIALSGIDGAGKSTQAELLSAGLRALGYDAVVQWARITTEPSLRAIASPVNGLLSLRGRLSRSSSRTLCPRLDP